MTPGSQLKHMTHQKSEGSVQRTCVSMDVSAMEGLSHQRLVLALVHRHIVSPDCMQHRQSICCCLLDGLITCHSTNTEELQRRMGGSEHDRQSIIVPYMLVQLRAKYMLRAY
jgi:hypothetical protein